MTKWIQNRSIISGLLTGGLAMILFLAVAAFVIVCELLLPVAIVLRDPERILGLLLPSFSPVAKALGPMARWMARTVAYEYCYHFTWMGMPIIQMPAAKAAHPVIREK
jgi:CBS domain containing-hemolysin-like protein